MTSNWDTVQLKDIVQFKTGKLDSNAAEDGGQYPFFTCSPTTLEINTHAFDTEAVLLAGNNANGVFSVKYYKGKFNAYQRTYVITPLDESVVSVKWLYFRIKHVTSELQKMSVGTATKFLTKKILDAYEVELPPIDVQEQQAQILWGLQDKLDLNNQTNYTLEEMAQAIFKSWFVDFDPVKAKMNGEQPEGMNATTASLFPEKLVESELGLIPEGWEVCLLNQKSEIKYGKNLPKTKLLDEGYPVFGGNGVIGYYSSYLYEDEQVLVSCRGAASGKVLRSLPKSFITNNSLVIDLSNSVLNINYVEPYLKGCNLEEYTSGSAQPQMTVANMAPVQILVPSEGILKSFDEMVKPLKSKIRANERQNLSLAALRDTLLPKLLLGEIELDGKGEVA